MPDAIPHSMSLPMMHKLHRLAEQRAIYFAELATSGRWKHYYTREELDSKLKETAGLAAYWQQAIGIARAADAQRNDMMPPALVPPTFPTPTVAPSMQTPSNVTTLFARAG